MPSPRDQNFVSTLRGALNTNGRTIVNVEANPTNHTLSISDGTSGTDFGTTNAQRDPDHKAVLLGISSADGITPVEIYADVLGNLLVKST